jgi:acyl carrier protein
MKPQEIRGELEALLRKANQLKQNEPISEMLVLFTQEGSADSVTALKLIMEIEEIFGITVEDDEIRPENFETVSGLIRFIETKLGD